MVKRNQCIAASVVLIDFFLLVAWFLLLLFTVRPSEVDIETSSSSSVASNNDGDQEETTTARELITNFRFTSSCFDQVGLSFLRLCASLALLSYLSNRRLYVFALLDIASIALPIVKLAIYARKMALWEYLITIQLCSTSCFYALFALMLWKALKRSQYRLTQNTDVAVSLTRSLVGSLYDPDDVQNELAQQIGSQAEYLNVQSPPRTAAGSKHNTQSQHHLHRVLIQGDDSHQQQQQRDVEEGDSWIRTSDNFDNLLDDENSVQKKHHNDDTIDDSDSNSDSNLDPPTPSSEECRWRMKFLPGSSSSFSNPGRPRWNNVAISDQASPSPSSSSSSRSPSSSARSPSSSRATTSSTSTLEQLGPDQNSNHSHPVNQ